MVMKKYGKGRILTDDEKEKKTAAENWTDEDREELERELTEDPPKKAKKKK